MGSGRIGVGPIRVDVLAGLEGEQFAVDAGPGHQLGVVALVGDQAAVEDVDAVGGADAGEAVGDEQDGAVPAQLADEGEQGLFGAGVEGGGRLVGDEERGVPVDRPRAGDPLPLAAGQVVAGVVLAGQRDGVPLEAKERPRCPLLPDPSPPPCTGV